MSLLMITCSMKLLVETVNSDHTRFSLSHRNCVIIYVLCVYAPSTHVDWCTHVDWRLWVSVCAGNVFGAMHICSM